MAATRLAPTPAELAALARKYRTLATLKAEREEAVRLGQDRFVGEAFAARGVAFRALARDFPGALRELERTETAALAGKAERVEAAARGGDIEPWMRLVWDFHAMLREVLALRLFLQKQPECSEEHLRAHHAQLPDAGALVEDAVTARPAIERPPEGRLLSLVWPALAARYGLSSEHARLVVFGPIA